MRRSGTCWTMMRRWGISFKSTLLCYLGFHNQYPCVRCGG